MRRLILLSALFLGSASPTQAQVPQGPSPKLAAVESPWRPQAHLPGLHNVHILGDSILSGAVPEGDAAFDELKALDVKTIISVDGAAPDVARAEARGLRYIHIPITYAEVTEAQRLEIARAMRDLPGPVYIHCHHGKHRGPAAAAAAAIALGIVTPDQGIAFMKEAGTASSYAGLYSCVAASLAATPAQLDAACADFPAARRAHGIVGAMVEVDQAYELLANIRAAGWKVPEDHPDLVPAAEAGRLTDNLRHSADETHGADLDKNFGAMMRSAIESASTLEEAIVRSAQPAEIEQAWKAVAASCKECHALYRDQKRD